MYIETIIYRKILRNSSIAEYVVLKLRVTAIKSIQITYPTLIIDLVNQRHLYRRSAIIFRYKEIIIDVYKNE